MAEDHVDGLFDERPFRHAAIRHRMAVDDDAYRSAQYPGLSVDRASKASGTPLACAVSGRRVAPWGGER